MATYFKVWVFFGTATTGGPTKPILAYESLGLRVALFVRQVKLLYVV